MLSTAQYNLMVNLKASLENNISESNRAIEDMQKAQKIRTASMQAASTQEDLFARLLSIAQTDEEKQFAQVQKSQHALVRNTMKKQIEDLQASIETERTKIRDFRDQLGVFYSGGIRGEIRAYEKAHSE